MLSAHHAQTSRALSTCAASDVPTGRTRCSIGTNGPRECDTALSLTPSHTLQRWTTQMTQKHKTQ
eukprot:6903632-Lingulodinium_polyedra.AAC.1